MIWNSAYLKYNWATSRENLYLGVCTKVKLKPSCYYVISYSDKLKSYKFGISKCR